MTRRHEDAKDTKDTLMFRKDSPLSESDEAIVTAALDVGYTVHRHLGPGFREKIYERAYCLELDSRGIEFECEKAIEVRYKEWNIPGQKIDLIVAKVVLVELKSVPRLRKLHRSQVLSYLKTTGLRVGLLMNFNAVMFKGNVQRIVN
jgi:GxxExxY protein